MCLNLSVCLTMSKKSTFYVCKVGHYGTPLIDVSIEAK